MHRIISTYFYNLNSINWKNLKEIGKCLDTYDLPMLSQDEVNNLNRHIATNVIEIVILRIFQFIKAQDGINSAQNINRFSKKKQYYYSSNYVINYKRKNTIKDPANKKRIVGQSF